ncbi:MAG: ATP-binding cassette domain-containing protein [Planctomycetes bacterium]|nr:ATP-binding cassette domain-containing protein [Planctomycetota bacterium]
MIKVDRITKRFGSIVAVDGVEFEVQRGEVLGFLGPNGAGKSTTMKILTCFLEPDSGTATVAGHDILRDPVGVRRQIGYVPENAPLYGDMTVASFLKFVGSVRGMSSGSIRGAIDRVVEQCALSGVVQQTIETLSKGYKRRVGLAQALLHDPDVLILDEPTDGLDPNQKHHVREMIRGMGAEKCIVISTHILEEVDAVCSRAIIIGRGRLLADGKPDELKARGGGRLDVYFRKVTTDGEAA